MKMLPHLLVIALLTSCSMKKNLDEMHDRTVQVSKVSVKMNDKMTDLSTESAWLGSLLKQGDTSRTRDEAIISLIEADSLAAKTLYASKFYYAFEFQVWKTSKIEGVDPLEIREHLKQEAVIEFVKTISELVPENSKWKISATSSNNIQRSLYALVATMHKKNPYQKELLTGLNIEPISFLDIVEESLQKVELLNKGLIDRDALSLADKEVLREEQMMRYLLKLRYKVLPVIALGRISNIQDNFFKKLGMLLSKWTPKFKSDEEPIDSTAGTNKQLITNLNLEQVFYATDIFEEAFKCAKYLITIGEMPTLDAKVLIIYHHMNLKPLFKIVDESGSDAQRKALEDFEAAALKVIELN